MQQPLNADTQRKAIIARVQKLSKMTTANGCSETEAQFANERISALMAEYALTQDEISIKADAAGCLKDEFIFFGRDYGDWMALQSSIARLYACKNWTGAAREEDILGLGFETKIRPFVFFGFASDVTACIATMSICFTAVATESDKQKKKSRDFAYGMVSRLCERINELKPKMQTGTGLIVLKDQLVTDEFAKLNMKFRYVSNNRNVDADAFNRGRAAGDRVSLNGNANGVRSNNGQPLRLN